MITLVAAVGWGLLTFGAITHVWHHDRLRSLLAMHLDREVVPAAVLTGVEIALAVALPIAFFAELKALRWLAVAAGLLALGFVVWVARLLVTGSELPCACSFSEGPTSWWSLLRSVATALVALFVIVDLPADDAGTSAATFAVGLALAGVAFVLPDAVVWPDTSRALMRRLDAHAPASGSAPR